MPSFLYIHTLKRGNRWISLPRSCIIGYVKHILLQAGSLVLPVTALIVIPACIEPDLSLGSTYLVLAGVFIGGIGLVLMVKSVHDMVRYGKGTLAPWAPAQYLVTQGIYSRVRNPMISGVVIMLSAQALIVNSFRIALWAGVFLAVNAVYIRYAEEPALAKRFPKTYAHYASRVPRWIPRIKRS